MSVYVEVLARIVCGVLSDPGFSSKEPKKVVEKAMDIYKEFEVQVDVENKKRHPVPPAPPQKVPGPTGK